MLTNVSSRSRADETQVKSGNGLARVRVVGWRGYLPTFACIWAGTDADKLGVFISSPHSITERSFEMVEKTDFGRLSISEIRVKAEAAFSRRFRCDVLSEVRPVHVPVTDVDSGETIPRDADTAVGQKLYLTILLEKEREYQELVVRGLEEARRRLKQQQESLQDARRMASFEEAKSVVFESAEQRS